MQRQKEMVKHLFHECMSLEELLEESVNTLGPDARDILAQVRQAHLSTANKSLMCVIKICFVCAL